MKEHLMDYPPILATPDMGMQASIDQGHCVYCNAPREHNFPRFSCDACQELVSEGFPEAEDSLHWLNIRYFRMGVLLCARQMGFRGDYVRAIAHDVENQRKELWGPDE